MPHTLSSNRPSSTSVLKLPISYHANQYKIFFETKARYKIIPKGRRFGLTRGFANFVINKMVEGVGPVLWVDTTNGNIDRYVERYFNPVLKNLPKDKWKWRQLKKELRIFNSICDFRSADRPENIEGFGYALMILNEAGIILKNRYLWNNAIRPMIMDYSADVLIGGTPKGKRVKGEDEDCLYYQLYQRCLEEQKEVDAGQRDPNDRKWLGLTFSSYDNPLLPREEIEELELDTPSSVRDQEIYAKFIDPGEAVIFDRSWWKYYEELPMNYLRKIQSWDTAFKKKKENDYNVCTTWIQTETGFYLVDMFRSRMTYPELKRQAVLEYEKHMPDEILIEDKASGQSLCQDLMDSTTLPIKPIQVDIDKIARANAASPMIESGNVHLPKKAPWLTTLLNEAADFPNGEFDDIVDSISQAINHLKTKISMTPRITTAIKRESINILRGY